jgi:hypothetical protein
VNVPPNCLPPRYSTKWHNRRRWDYLGYVRVHQIADPHWQRDPSWLLRLLIPERPDDHGQAQDLIDAAIAAAKQCRTLRRRSAEGDGDFEARRGRRWDEILAPLDEFLELRQRDHLRAVREAGASGPQVPIG